MRHLFAIALSMPLGTAFRKAIAFGWRRLSSRLAGWKQRLHCAYPSSAPTLAPQLREAVAARIADARVEDWRNHRFDLLGSGPVQVAHGAVHDGFGGHRYGPGPLLGPDWRAELAARAWPASQGRARAILGLIDDPDYRPIDWHVDFISGYRWSERCWGGSVPYGHRPGVDVKLPWELARLQHLPAMALHFGATGAAALAGAFRNQVLDFLGSNPPGWGVNWACAMDVAIRAANMLLAWDLFRAAGWRFDEDFERELAAAALAHGRHVRANLEWNAHHRGNHYMADICGLAFCAVYLGDGDGTVFCRRELDAEIKRQFLADGGNFEASTAYHRLSAEMALYAAALMGGLSEEAYDRLSLVAGFSAAVTKPSGAIIQIGDNDSGRFFCLEGEARPLDHSSVIRAARGLFRLGAQGEDGPETRLVAALSGRPPRAVSEPNRRPPGGQVAVGIGRRTVIRPPDPSALEGLEPVALPDFGLFLWRNARCFIAVRCGPVGQNGNGGHAHNDQLSLELEIDGIAWARDPGCHVYTSDLAARNRYRSVLAHAAPRRGTAEPARFIAPFRLENSARARALRFDTDFVGVHHGFGEAVYRRVCVEEGAVIVEDWPYPAEELVVNSPAGLAAAWGLTVPFSPGYGLAPSR